MCMYECIHTYFCIYVFMYIPMSIPVGYIGPLFAFSISVAIFYCLLECDRACAVRNVTVPVLTVHVL